MIQMSLILQTTSPYSVWYNQDYEANHTCASFNVIFLITTLEIKVIQDNTNWISWLWYECTCPFYIIDVQLWLVAAKCFLKKI